MKCAAMNGQECIDCGDCVVARKAPRPPVRSETVLAVLVHLTDALQDCCECHIYERKPTQSQWDQYDAALKEGKELTANAELSSGEAVRSDDLLACLDMLQRLTDRCGMVLRGVAEQTELFGLVTEAKELLKANAQHEPRRGTSRSAPCSCSASGYDPECKWEGHHHA